MKIVIILITLFLLRLIGINQSMWLDEAISVNVAKFPINRIVSNFSINDFHPPVHYWFLNIWQGLFGSGVVVMRLSSILFSLITVFLVYRIGTEIKNKKVGLWAAVLTGINPLFIYFSQELRMYMMVVMLLTGALYFFVKLNKKANWKNILGFNILTGLSFVTFYGSVFLIATMLLYLLINKKIKLTFLNSLGLIIAIAVISPLLISQLKNSANMLNQVINWGLVLGKVNLKNLFLIPIKFTVGKVSWYPKFFYYLVAGLSTLVVWALATKEMFKDKMLGFLLITPIILGIIFSFKSPLLQYFRFIYLIPVLSLLLASIKSINIKKILVIIFLTFSLISLINPKMHREDWKNLSTKLTKDYPIYMISSFSDPINFYKPGLVIKDIKTINPDEEKIKVIPYGQEIHGINSQEKVEKLGYIKTGEENFRGIKIEDWEK